MFTINRKLCAALGVSAVAAALLVASGSDEASAATTTLHCGQTVSVNTTMANNLACSGTIGLKVQGGVTLDLGHHTLTGPGTGTGILTNITAGKTKIQNGTVTKWGFGIAGAGGTDPTSVSNVTASFNQTGVGMSSGGGPLLMAGSRMLHNAQSGVFVMHQAATIQTSTFDSNGVGFAEVSEGATVTGCEFIRNQYGVDSEDGGATVNSSRVEYNHIGLFAGSSGRFYTNGTMIYHNGIGAMETDSSGFTIANSTVSTNTIGLETINESGGETIITGSSIVSNGIGYQGYNQVKATGNTFTSNGTAYETYGNPNLNPSPAADGFNVYPQDIEGNIFNNNGSAILLNGVFLTPSKIGTNRVTNNLNVGIIAPGAQDLGGNVAFGNGGDPQCSGVVCATS